MNLKEKILIVGLLLLSIGGISQSIKINEYKTKLDNCQTDSCYVFNSYQIARHYLSQNLDSTIFYGNLSAQRAKIFDNTLEFRGYLIVAIVYQKKREFGKADSLNTILKAEVGKVDNFLRTAFFNNLANFYYRRMEYDSAVIYYNKALYNLQSDDENYYEFSITLKQNISNIYKDKYKYNKAISSLLDADKLLNSNNISDSLYIMKTKSGLSLMKGMIYKDMKDYDSTEKEYIKAIEFSTVLPKLKYKAYSNLGNLYHMLKDTSALRIVLDTLGENFNILYKSTKRVYLDLKVDYLFTKGKYSEAIETNDEFKTFLLSNKYSKYIYLYYNNAGFIHEKTGEISKANKSFKLSLESMSDILGDSRSLYASTLFDFIVTTPNLSKDIVNKMHEYNYLRDTIENEIVKEEVFKAKEKYETEKKEAENKVLLQQNQLKEAKIKTQRMMMAFGGLGLLLLSGLLFIIYRQKKKQKKLNEVLADRNIKISLISREIAHRAKNQLALATNLISYQKNKAEDIGAKQLIEESENKLKALSSVNKRLSDDDELARVNLKDVVEEVVANNIYSLAISNIDYDISLPNTAIDSNKMSLIALIINELTTNSIKHAFKDNPNPKITVEGTIKDDKFTMKYKDNGNIKSNIKSEGLGQSLITGLVNQLQGIYKIDVSLGFVFDLNIPI